MRDRNNAWRRPVSGSKGGNRFRPALWSSLRAEGSSIRASGFPCASANTLPWTAGASAGNHEAIRRSALTETKRDVESLTVHTIEQPEPVTERKQSLVQPSEWRFGLKLDTGHAEGETTRVRSRRRGRVKQRRFPTPGSPKISSASPPAAARPTKETIALSSRSRPTNVWLIRPAPSSMSAEGSAPMARRSPEIDTSLNVDPPDDRVETRHAATKLHAERRSAVPRERPDPQHWSRE